MTTTDRRRLLDADDFRNDNAEAEAFLLASQPPRPSPSKDEQRQLAELQARLDEAAATRDAALAARMRAGRALMEADEVERARVTEGQGLRWHLVVGPGRSQGAQRGSRQGRPRGSREAIS